MPNFIQIEIQNSDSPDECEIHRYLDGQTKLDAIKIADGLPPDTTFKDFNVKSAQLYWYFVRAITGGLSTDSAASSKSVTLDQLYIHAVGRTRTLSNAVGDLSVGLVNEAPQALEITPQTGTFRLKGRPRPLATIGQIVAKTLHCSAEIQRVNAIAYTNLMSIYRQGALVCARDQMNNRLFGKMSRMTTSEQGQIISVSFDVVQTEYSEGL